MRLLMEVAQILPSLLNKSVNGCIEYFLVFRNNNALVDCKVIGRVIVLKRLMVSITDNSHH